ncbi:MAG TPA: hypothetical protein VGQ00_03050 [Candidatus Norongarragalinales archaeon]|nr:hypothetical protein [Candidatus Norongarragalinales archaeon]
MKTVKLEKCARCGHESHHLSACWSCGRMIDTRCEKSSKRLRNHSRVLICKDDWGKLPKRKAYESAL